MKTTTRRWQAVLVLAGAFTAAAMTAQAGQGVRAYGWVDAGGVLMDDTMMTSFFNQNVSGAKVTFDPGFRLGLGFGAEFNDYLAAELETGFTYNPIDDITGATIVDASLYQTPILVNLKVQYPIELRHGARLIPMIGGGVGGASIMLDMDNITIGNVTTWGSAYDFVFAYQGLAGLNLEINKNLSIGVFYRYFGAESPDWEPDYYYNAFGKMSMDSLQSHQFSLGATFRF